MPCALKNENVFYICFLGLVFKMGHVTGLTYGWKRTEKAVKGGKMVDSPLKGRLGFRTF